MELVASDTLTLMARCVKSVHCVACVQTVPRATRKKEGVQKGSKLGVVHSRRADEEDVQKESMFGAVPSRRTDKEAVLKESKFDAVPSRRTYEEGVQKGFKLGAVPSRRTDKEVVQKGSKFDVVPSRRTDGKQADDTISDEQAEYMTAWRVDKALQLAAAISNFCT